jgi:predicted ATP-grasp superfamily ATP-dependent carboligase
VSVGAETRRSIAGISKFAADSFTYHSPLLRVKQAMNDIAAELQKRDIEYLIPVTDVSLFPVLQYRDQLFSNIQVPYPHLSTVLQASDKYFLFQLAQECGVPIPKTIFIDQLSQPAAILAKIDRFPLVVKPARSLFIENNHLLRAGVSYVYSKEQLLQLMELKGYLQRYPFLIQERVVGTGIGYFVLLHEGKPVAEFSHRRIREKPPCGGISVYSESLPVASDVRAYSLRLLRALDWSGVAMVEFKIDKYSGTPMLMEINGRFWGSLQLAIGAGVDFPHLLVRMTSNETDAGSEIPYELHRRWRWLLGDLDHLLLRCLKSDEALDLPPGHPSRVETLYNFLSGFRHRDTLYDVFSTADMQPFVFEFCSYIRQLFRSN